MESNTIFKETVIYIADTYHHRIHVASAASMNIIMQLGSGHGKGNGNLCFPYGLCVFAEVEGLQKALVHLYVSEWGNG